MGAVTREVLKNDGEALVPAGTPVQFSSGELPTPPPVRVSSFGSVPQEGAMSAAHPVMFIHPGEVRVNVPVPPAPVAPPALLLPPVPVAPPVAAPPLPVVPPVPAPPLPVTPPDPAARPARVPALAGAPRGATGRGPRSTGTLGIRAATTGRRPERKRKDHDESAKPCEPLRKGVHERRVSPPPSFCQH